MRAEPRVWRMGAYFKLQLVGRDRDGHAPYLRLADNADNYCGDISDRRRLRFIARAITAALAKKPEARRG